MRRFLALSLASFLAVPSSSFAQSFKILGSRPMGMGGAHVAVAEGDLAQYWNPAGLALRKGLALEIPAGAGGEFTKDLLKDANELSDLADKIDAIQAKTDGDNLNLTEYQDFLNALVQINDLNKEGTGVLGEIQGGVNIQLSRFAVSVNNFTEFGVDPFVDTVNMGLNVGAGVDAATDFNGGGFGGNGGVNAADEAQLAAILTDMVGTLGIQLPDTAANVANELIAQAQVSQSPAEVAAAIDQIQQYYDQAKAFLPSGVNPFSSNLTSLAVRGAAITEVSIGAGGGLPIIGNLPLLKRISVGGNLKLMRGQVGYGRVFVVDDSEEVEFDDLIDDYKDNIQNSSTYGVDAGALFDLLDTPFRSQFGLLGRNLNRPSFEQPQAAKDDGISDYVLDPQVRAGWAWHPMKWLVVAADLDLTNNTTSLPGYKSRQAGAGVEVNFFNQPWLNLALRGGAMKNIAETDAALAYTAGLGLNVMHFHLDIGAALSSKTVLTDEGDEIPASARVSAQLGLRF